MQAFQGRTADSAAIAMEANRPRVTNQKSFHVKIGRAHDRAEPVTDDAAEPGAELQAVTGETIAAPRR